MFSCFTMYAICQPVLDTRKQFVIHRIVKPLVSNVKYNMAKTNHIDPLVAWFRTEIPG